MQPTQRIFFAHVRAVNFIWIIWVCFFLQISLAACQIDIAAFIGLTPHTFQGLCGVFFMPFLHASFGHIILNSIGLIMVLLPLYMAFKDETHVPEAILKIVLISGILVWIFGRQNATHIGASALVYGLISYIMVAGIVYKHPLLIACSISTVFWMGGSLLDGMMPSVEHPYISWEGHLCGAVAGLIVGLRKRIPAPEKTFEN